MRLDLFLKRCCLTRQRSEAKRACDNGIVTVDDQPAKAARTVQVGQRVGIAFLDRFLEVKILNLPVGNVSRANARDYYEVLRDETHDVTDF
ncbi:MAG: S4 domain-containing protein [bacterium]|nr:S4 domain-containing protein [bacterium]